LLVPKGHRAEQISPLFKSRPHASIGIVGPACMLHFETQRSGEGNRIIQMPAVSRHAGTQASTLSYGNTRVRSSVRTQPPGVIEVILAARPFDAGIGLPIDIEIVIALSEPAWLILNDTQNRTYVVPSSLNRQNLQALPGYCRQGLAVQGMEV